MHKLLKLLGNVVYYGLAVVMVTLLWPYATSGANALLSLVACFAVLTPVCFLKVVVYEPWLEKRFSPTASEYEINQQ